MDTKFDLQPIQVTPEAIIIPKIYLQNATAVETVLLNDYLIIRPVITVRPSSPDALTTSTEEPTADVWHFLANYTGKVTAPEDWAAEHDHYLYGIAKQKERADVP